MYMVFVNLFLNSLDPEESRNSLFLGMTVNSAGLVRCHPGEQLEEGVQVRC